MSFVAGFNEFGMLKLVRFAAAFTQQWRELRNSTLFIQKNGLLFTLRHNSAIKCGFAHSLSGEWNMGENPQKTQVSVNVEG